MDYKSGSLALGQDRDDLSLESFCEPEAAFTADTEAFERRQRSQSGIEGGLKRGRTEAGKAGLI